MEKEDFIRRITRGGWSACGDRMTRGWCARFTVRGSARVVGAPSAPAYQASQHIRVVRPAARAKCLGEEAQRRSRVKLDFPPPTVGAVSHRQSFSFSASGEHAFGVRSILECAHLVTTLSCPRSLTRYIAPFLLFTLSLTVLCAVWSLSRSVCFTGCSQYRCTIENKHRDSVCIYIVSLFSYWPLPSRYTSHHPLHFVALTHTLAADSSRTVRLYARRVYQRSVQKHGRSTANGSATGSRAKRGGVERGWCILHHRSHHPHSRERFLSGYSVFGKNADRKRCQGKVFPGSRWGPVPLCPRFPAQSGISPARRVSREGKIETGSEFLRSARLGTCHSGER